MYVTYVTGLIAVQYLSVHINIVHLLLGAF